jgi:hypothetical protein
VTLRGSSSAWLERLPVTQEAASSSLVYPAKDAQTIMVWAFLFSAGTFRLSRCHIYSALLSTILSTPDSCACPLNAVIKAVNTVQ